MSTIISSFKLQVRSNQCYFGWGLGPNAQAQPLQWGELIIYGWGSLTALLLWKFKHWIKPVKAEKVSRYFDTKL